MILVLATCCASVTGAQRESGMTDQRWPARCGFKWTLPPGLGANGSGAAPCLVVAICLSGCMVGPNYRGPDVSVSDTWLDVKSQTPMDATEAVDWWTHFNDPILTSFVQEAFAQNLTLREAGLRVIQARAQRGIAVGQFFPQTQDFSAQGTRQQLSKNAPLGVADRSFSDYSVALQAA